TPSVRAARASAMHLDGRLDEAAWAGAEVAGGFVQQRPNSGAAATERTEVRVLYDDQAVYVGARMWDTHPDSIAAQLARRDASGIYSDWFHVVIDSYHDRRTAFRFAVNPLGVQKDVFHSNDGNEDVSWDAVWEAATSRDSAGWTAELRIPLSQLRYGRAADGTERVWGINFLRDLARRDERTYWSPIPPNYPGFVSRAGELRGLAGLGTPRRLEVLPYTSARLSRDPRVPGDPFHGASDFSPSVGADVRMGLPKGLTLTGTINPDFGQVEVDPAVVNLSAFETFFPEKRPFFVEGSDIFGFGSINSFNNFGAPQFFYTRRIGRAPHRDLGNDWSFVDQPAQSTILGAAKLSGKTPGGWSVGVLDALTSREEGRFLDDAGVRRTAAVEPLTNYFVGRLRRDFQGGRTVVGGIATAGNRDLADSVFRRVVRTSAYTGGLDWEHDWGAGRAWSLTGFAAGSRVAGSRDILYLTQRSSSHYFQRPDQGYMRLDSSRTSLRGWDGALAVQHSGDYDLSLAYQGVSPGFESNDLGFQGHADRHQVSTFYGHRVNKPTRLTRSYTWYAYSNHSWNFGGDPIYQAFSGAGNATFTNLWNVSGQATYGLQTKDDGLTRGGPRALAPAFWDASINWGSDPRRLLSASGYLEDRVDHGGSYTHAGNVSLAVRPSSSVQVSVGPGLTFNRNAAQYVRSVADPLATATFGRRYVFGDVKQTTLSMDTRVDWTFTPKLSLQLFAQPFVSSGEFSRYKELARPASFDFAVYGRDRGTLQQTTGADGSVTVQVDPDGAGAAPAFTFGDQDFTVRSLRGNAVLRWEYRPGSALFFVWQQERSGDTGDGRFDARRDFGGVFSEPAHNVFLIKATYWLSR
ncbi:MAG: hypothetical protein JWM27_1732, partial [Gemmatimonadetes bacterium]|nr:hypothetical protein [Gemmatimonadota bacterium]